MLFEVDLKNVKIFFEIDLKILGLYQNSNSSSLLKNTEYIDLFIQKLYLHLKTSCNQISNFLGVFF